MINFRRIYTSNPHIPIAYIGDVISASLGKLDDNMVVGQIINQINGHNLSFTGYDSVNSMMATNKYHNQPLMIIINNIKTINGTPLEYSGETQEKSTTIVQDTKLLLT